MKYFLVKLGEEVWTLVGGPYEIDQAHQEGARLIEGGFAKEVRILRTVRTLVRGDQNG